jgi:hypothetical protein
VQTEESPQLMRGPLGRDNEDYVLRAPFAITPLLVPAVLLACASARSGAPIGPHPCLESKTVAPFDSTRMAELAGRYRLRLVSEASIQKGESRSGKMELVVPDSAHASYQPSPLSSQRHVLPLIGWTDVAVRELYGGAAVDPNSRDAANPGIRAVRGQLWIGYQPQRFHGGSTALLIHQVGPEGFSGRWVANLYEVLVDTTTGALVYIAGSFCALRDPAS